MGFVRGKLTLKGDKKKKKKKSRKTKHSLEKDESNVKEKDIESRASDDDDEIGKKEEVTQQGSSSGDAVIENNDDLTDAERRSLKYKKENQMRDLEKIAGKSHRERIEEFNTALGELSEHNDIPRVSAAGNG